MGDGHAFSLGDVVAETDAVRSAQRTHRHTARSHRPTVLTVLERRLRAPDDRVRPS
ncbi:hypothetical protein ABZZ20_06845 [Streptomyces sp. NPDC006430]|uniref:hypothetical protein n=1 Tax=Streptomyces sp. NPDC006430 TaxID=3154299 RepID=UPI0033BC10BF